MPAIPATSDLLELKLSEWNDVVSDETQCMRIAPAEEVKFLSSQNKNLAQYLKLHPEMAHELMVPSGFRQRITRKYERYLSGDTPLSVQNGAIEKHQEDIELFDALLPGQPTVHANPKNAETPTWREVNLFVCRNGVDTLSGEKMAPQHERTATGEVLRILRYKDKQNRIIYIKLSAKQWRLMWDHIICDFHNSGENTPADVEFIALHKAYHELAGTPPPHNDIKFPNGQQLAILLKQLEHRLRAAHVNRPNPCSECCPFRSGPLATNPQQFLSKAEAANLVADELLAQHPPVSLINPDPMLAAALARKGVQIGDRYSSTRCVISA